MTKHKLDEQVEDILQHYGIKGMKWDVKRTPEQIAGGGDEDDTKEVDEDGLLELMGDKVGDLVDALETKMGGIKDSIKKSGAKLLASLFGGKPKYNAEYSKKMGKAMKKAQEKNKNRSAAETFLKKRSDRAKKYMPKDKDTLIEGFKKQGYKKHKKSTTPITDKYKFKVGKDADRYLEKKKKEGFKANK